MEINSFPTFSFQYHDLSTNCFFTNFTIFNKRSKLALVLMMQLTATRPKSIVGESVLRFVFSMETFLKVRSAQHSAFSIQHWLCSLPHFAFINLIFLYFQVVKTSYSYVALMRNIKQMRNSNDKITMKFIYPSCDFGRRSYVLRNSIECYSIQ